MPTLSATLATHSDGGFDLPEGNLREVLHRLENQGLLAGWWSAESGRQRRVDRLTRASKAALGHCLDGFSRSPGVESRFATLAGREVDDPHSV